ncbi:MAG: aldose epimerase family protein, partial [Candidatus Faecousia sp.]|nr:aldose epimerase family protein [Candidatus Faecousia sp.]
MNENETRAALLPFGSLRGIPVYLARLTDGDCAAEVLTYGAALRSLTVPDGAGRLTDVVLGFDRLEDYVNQDCFIGATVGPVANRIAGAACPLNGRTLALDPNEAPNCLHSGLAGFDKVVWTATAISERAVALSYVHPDGLGGFPGDLRVTVTYTLIDRTLRIDYRAVSERDTVLNLTNHSYFNLNGHAAGSIADHAVCIRADRFTPTDAASVPTGALLSVTGTPMDLRQAKPVRAGLSAEYDQLRLAKGYDHNWVPDGSGFREIASVAADRSGLRMRVWTDRPGVQFYTGNYLPAGLRGKDGAVYGPRAALCLETQAWPDAPNHAGFPSIVLRAG